MVTLLSQNLTEFDLHARAVLGFPIPEIEMYGPSASAVVLADKHADSVSYDGVGRAMALHGVDVRIFGKPSTRPYRRMAVCLARANTIEKARATALKAATQIQIIY
tara:strand:- start:571 stop:888 length:318 start_codon:yes stop_codon:yes gene_type:complete